MPSVVENTIQQGTRFVGKTADTVGCFDPVNRVRVILNAQTGAIITVIRRGSAACPEDCRSIDQRLGWDGAATTKTGHPHFYTRGPSVARGDSSSP